MTVKIKISVMLEDKSFFQDGIERSIDIEAFVDATGNPVVYFEAPDRCELSLSELASLRHAVNVVYEELNDD